ncbi:hypothetical protein Tco_0359003, partial [Tanacetum coccineum]
SIWEIDCDNKGTVGWRNILSLRDKVRKHVWWKCGNGESINVWHDNWCQASPLKFAELGQLQVPIINDGIMDKALWRSGNGMENEFKVSNVWKDMRSDEQKVDWLPERWDQIVIEMKNLPLNKNIWSIVRRIVYNAAVYYIWQERNKRIFRNEKRDKETIVKIVKENVMMKLLGLKVKESKTVKEVEEKWKIRMKRGEDKVA